MARQRFDIGSKWLIHNQSKSALLVGGLSDVRRCEPMPGEVIQNRRYPDGLLRAFLGNDPKHHHVLMEIATFPEKRALKQAMDDLTLAYSALGHLPELVMLVLHQKGKFRINFWRTESHDRITTHIESAGGEYSQPYPRHLENSLRRHAARRDETPTPNHRPKKAAPAQPDCNPLCRPGRIPQSAASVRFSKYRTKQSSAVSGCRNNRTVAAVRGTTHLGP
jgi:hypothetical protein